MAMTTSQENLLAAAKAAAKELDDGGRELTSLIGELSVCKIMGLNWQPSAGYDATDGTKLYQIKTRKSWTTPTVNSAGRLGRFGTEKKGYNFDWGIYGELDKDFNVSGLWKIKADELQKLEDPKSSQGLHVGKLKKEAKSIPLV